MFQMRVSIPQDAGSLPPLRHFLDNFLVLGSALEGFDEWNFGKRHDFGAFH